jgi:hypothetical protein
VSGAIIVAAAVLIAATMRRADRTVRGLTPVVAADPCG